MNDPKATTASRKSRLVAAGIQGPNLDVLAAIEALSPEEIDREARRLSANKQVRNVPAVLARSLSERFGVVLSSRPALAKKELSAVKQIEDKRRQLQQQAEKSARSVARLDPVVPPSQGDHRSSPDSP